MGDEQYRVVEIRLERNADGSINRHGPFVVFHDEGGGSYVNDPRVIAQLSSHEDGARFEAKWNGNWKFGRRVTDPTT
jgi:hypothetical protein